VRLESGYRIDLLVENAIIVELKACEAIAPVHRIQIAPVSQPVQQALRFAAEFSCIADERWHHQNEKRLLLAS
jgi:hypothetical protein